MKKILGYGYPLVITAGLAYALFVGIDERDDRILDQHAECPEQPPFGLPC